MSDIDWAFGPVVTQYNTAYLRSPTSNSENCIIDWEKAQHITALTRAINGDPCRDWSFLKRLPCWGKGLQWSVADDLIKLEFPVFSDGSEQKRYQLASMLVDAKCNVYAYVGLDIDRGGIKTTQAGRFYNLVGKIVSNIDQGNRWHGVWSDASVGMTNVEQLDVSGDVKNYADPYIMKETLRYLQKVHDGIQATMTGVTGLTGDIEEAVNTVNKLTGRLRSNCMQICGLINGCSPAEKAAKLDDPFIYDWGCRVGNAWANNDMSQMDAFQDGWSKIKTNLQLANTLGPELVSKLSSAIQATRDRTTDPGGPDKVFSTDALHNFMVIFKHTRTNMEIWLRAVAELLIINWQYMLGPNNVQNPMQALFAADIDFITQYPLDNYLPTS